MVAEERHELDFAEMRLIKTKKIRKNTFDGAVIRTDGNVDDLDGDYQALYIGEVLSKKDEYGSRVVKFTDRTCKVAEETFDSKSYKKYRAYKDGSVIRFFPEKTITTNTEETITTNTEEAISKNTEEAIPANTSSSKKSNEEKKDEEDQQDDGSVLSFCTQQKKRFNILISKYETKIRELEAENRRLQTTNQELELENKRLKTPEAKI